MFGELRSAFRAAGLAAMLSLVAIAPANAGERRAIVTEDTDFFGRDLETLKDVDLDMCEQACVDDAACQAFTYNVNARWCFKKAEVGDLRQFVGAVSGKIVEASVVDLDLEATRLAELGFVSRDYIDEARQLKGTLEGLEPNDTLEQLLAQGADYLANGNALDASDMYRLALKLDSARFDIWRSYTAANLDASSPDWQINQQLQTQSTAGAINSYLLAATDDERADSFWLLARSFAARENWKLAIRSGRESLALVENPDIQAQLEAWIGEYGFRITENTVDSKSGAPRICIAFSDAIAKDDPNIADYIAVEGGDKLAVEAETNQICIAGVSYGNRYAITVRQGLPAQNSDDSLIKTSELDVYVGDREPSVRFVGRAYVLPKGPDATIPVVTVNVDTLNAEVVRISDRNLVRTISEGGFLDQLSPWQVEDVVSRSGEPVWKGTVSVKRETNAEVTTAVPVGEVVKDLKPGVYAMVARSLTEKDEWSAKATQWFIVTDMALSSMTGNDGLHVIIRSLSTAGAVKATELKLIALNNDILATATTDGEGYARFDPGLVRGTGGTSPALVTAQSPDGDFAFLDLTKPAFDLTDRGVEGRAPPLPVDVFMTSERGVYRPGEAVNITALTRDSKVAALTDVPLTLVVARPDGVEHLRRLAADEGAGGRDLSFDLPDGAMRGTWQVAAYTDPKGQPVSAASFLVEDFQPERIDFTVTTDATLLTPGETVTADLKADWLYGAPAAGLGIEGEVYVKKADGIESAPGYTFGLADEEFTPVAEPVQGEPTAEDGTTTVDLITPALPDTTLPLAAAVHVRVLDTNGRPVERRMTLPVSNGLARIGVDPQFDGSVDEGGNARFNVIVLDGEAQRASASGLVWSLAKLDTRYQWYNAQGMWNYEPIVTRRKIADGTIDVLDAEPAKLEAAVEWGEYELSVEDPSGAAMPVSTRFEAGWYVAPSADETPDLLKISLDKPTYQIGDTLTAHIEPRFPGIAFVSVVDDRLITMKTVEIPEGGADVTLPVTADWGPGAYVTATLIRPLDIAAKRMPQRALGVAWAAVDPGERLLQASIDVPAEMKPRHALPVEVALANVAPGEDAYVTIAAVDLGILNLTAFAAPAPEDWYFAQRQLGIAFRDVYGQLIDTTLGARGEVRSGGDGGGLAKLLGPPPTEQLVAFFQGTTKVGADGKLRASFDIPQFNGTVRVMAVAWSKTAVGHASADVLVRDPVVVQASLPNFLAPGDRSRLRLDLTNLTGPAGAYDLEVFAAGSLVNVGEAGKRTIDLAEKGKAEILVPLVAGAVGDETLTVNLTGPDGVTLTKTLTMPVRANEPPVSRVSTLSLVKGGGSLMLGSDVFAEFVPGTALATVTVGNVAGIDVPGLVHTLDKYPYGCTEQITSRALPLVYLDDVVLAAGLSGELPVRDRVAKAIEDVLVNQGSNGSFGLWSPGADDLWLDAYVTDFLTRAREKGYTVPPVPFDLAVTNLKNRIAYAADFTYGGQDIAYALYVLARNGRASMGDLRYYVDTKLDAFASPLAKAQLGAALALYGDMPKANTAFRAAIGVLSDKPDAAMAWRTDYGSDLRDGAAILTLASENKIEDVDISELSRSIQTLSATAAHTSTQEQGWMLLAANALLGKPGDLVLSVNGQRQEGAFTASFDAAALAPGVTVDNAGNGTVDARVTLTGVPTTPEPAGGNGYSLTRTHYDLNGEEVDPQAVKLGDRLVVALNVTTTQSTQARLIVDDPLPAGFTIDNPSLISAGDVSALSWLPLINRTARTEYRADRFVSAVDLDGSTTEFALAYMVRAIAPGTFARPAALVMDMYRPNMRARTETDAIEVIGPVQ